MAKLTIEQRKDMIIEYARKVVMYPRGSKGYDPVDMENLRYNIYLLEAEYHKTADTTKPIKFVLTSNPNTLYELNTMINKALNKVYDKPKEFCLRCNDLRNDCHCGVFLSSFEYKEGENN